MDLLKYSFFSNAIIAGILTAISCGIIGTYIVAKRKVFISGGITHSSFGGIGIGYFLGINPIITAAIFAVLSAIGIEYIAEKGEIREDSAIGILWSFGMALGIILIYITPGYAPNLMAYLFGNILAVSTFDINAMLLLNLIIIFFFMFFYKEILYISFDEEYMKTKGLPVTLFKYTIATLIALTIVINIRVVGIILVLSLLTIPQAISALFSNSFRNIMILSIFFAFIGTMSGLIFSYLLNIPSGASIIFSLVILFGIIKLFKILFSLKSKSEV
ncbi:metal ABC transporter permease [Haliovirga abyssi]|uniref:metal ABC transporter permease n=1 Tax=Haliovirga abyssi TaxID=2996794 RepID=UPI0027DB9C60|nr:metal ABC transporter permease [Haliovirga abyssi]